MRKWIPYVATMCLAGCQTWGPTWSEVLGERYSLAPDALEVGPTIIYLVDGYSPNYNRRDPVKMTSGPHKIVLQAVPPPSVRGLINQEEIALDAKPCVRYYINARFKTDTSTDWAPFINHEEQIAGCQLTAASPK